MPHMEAFMGTEAWIAQRPIFSPPPPPSPPLQGLRGPPLPPTLHRTFLVATCPSRWPYQREAAGEGEGGGLQIERVPF